MPTHKKHKRTPRRGPKIRAKDEVTYSPEELERQYRYRMDPHNPEAIAERIYRRYGTNVTLGPLSLSIYGSEEQLAPLYRAGWLTREPEGWVTFRHPFA